MLNSFQNGRFFRIFTTLLVHTATPTISTKNSFLNLRQFSPPYSTLTLQQNNPYNPSYSLCRSNFPPPCFCVQPSQLSTPKIFFLPHPFSQFSYGVLIFSFFPKVWTVVSGFTITDFLLLRIRKLIYCRQQSLMKMLAIRMANHSIHLFSYLQSIVSTSIHQ